jgi:transposase-like protein
LALILIYEKDAKNSRPNFKEEAVQLSYERHNISELAKELDVTAPQLYK